MTVATEKTDAFLRYIRSAEINKLKGKVIEKVFTHVQFYSINTMICHGMI